MKVFVKIVNLNEVIDIYADDKLKVIKFNNKDINFDAEKFVGEVSFITYNWKEENFNNNILDGERYLIKIVSNDNQERKIVGKNSFPENYAKLKQLIEEVKKYGY